jgi:tetrahydromethanopterin S-methyltransferase subunit C
MSPIAFSIVIGQWAAVVGCCVLLLKHTALPAWAAFLISLPVGAIVGAAVGAGLGLAIEFALGKRKRSP